MILVSPSTASALLQDVWNGLELIGRLVEETAVAVMTVCFHLLVFLSSLLKLVFLKIKKKVAKNLVRFHIFQY